MKKRDTRKSDKHVGIDKAATGIKGLDEITQGGLPRGRPTIVCGGPGTGKTMIGAEFLVRGIKEYGENGVLIAFEETPKDLAENFQSLGFDLQKLVNSKKLAMDFVNIERSEIVEAGDYDLEGLFIRLDEAIKRVNAKRIVLDTLEALFASFPNEFILRSELRRLFGWLKARGMTALITAERGETTLTRHGLEEYVSDCVILLTHEVSEDIATRNIRIVKYRGTAHGTNQYPFLIDEEGLSILPITAVGLDYGVSDERLSSGVDELDAMLGGKGFYRGSSVLVSGTAGTGKSSLAASFVNELCKRGKRAVYASTEESPEQIMRNMSSIGINLRQWVDAGLLHFHNVRPTLYGIEMHLVALHKIIDQVKPHALVIDPVSNFLSVSESRDVRILFVRLIDFLKSRGITSLFTSLSSSAGGSLEETQVGISSLMDSWILPRDVEHNGERTRVLYVLKSRGMEHSNQIREFLLTRDGIRLRQAYIGQGQVLTGTARQIQEARERREDLDQRQEAQRKRRELAQRQKAVQAQIEVMKVELQAVEEDMKRTQEEESKRQEELGRTQTRIAGLRKANGARNRKKKES